MEIQPEKQNIDQTFSTTIYYIDFYQRDYKWTEEPIRRLLDDVFYQFEETFQKHESLEPTVENINKSYPWYYLNTYVTNTVDGRVFVVDGQQRLTTLTIVLLVLLKKAKALGSETVGWLDRKISGYSGTQNQFWMNHEKHLHVFSDILDGKSLELIDITTGVTAENIVGNYQVVEKELDKHLDTIEKFDTFVHYFLLRLVLINLSVDTKHVPMVFEVINDRGVRLKPYEILKGKLLGQIDKIELDSGDYNGLWEDQVGKLNQIKDDEIDVFFRSWLKGKFAESRKDGQRFDGEYHRELFKSEINNELELDHNPAQVKSFLKSEFRYFAGLYHKIWTLTQNQTASAPAVFFNELNDLDSQYMLIMAACSVDDPEEDEKIAVVSAGLDKMFSLLQLQGAYDSNRFAVRLFEIAKELRGQPAASIQKMIERNLILEISDRRNQQVDTIFSHSIFRGMTVDRLNKRFTRYILGRVDDFIATGCKQEMKHPLRELVTSRGVVSGFHIEHILSYNDANLELFGGDEERFEQERNRLGAILLLKGRDNISSNNEPYKDKLKSYANTLYWNETLREDSYKSKLDFRAFKDKNELDMKPLAQFGPEELNHRHALLADVIEKIWC